MNNVFKEIKYVYDCKDYRFFERGDYNLNFGAIRAADPTPNVFNDLFFNVFKKNGSYRNLSWKGTTDPGLYWLNHPMNPNGTAILVPGQYRFKIGTHKGYPALVDYEPVQVYRDRNRDNAFDLDQGSIEEGLFSINIHKAGRNSTQVEKWSAGCPAFAMEEDYNEHWDIIMKSAALYGEIFTFTLFDECDFY